MEIHLPQEPEQEPTGNINAKNGERLIMYPDMAIIFDPPTVTK